MRSELYVRWLVTQSTTAEHTAARWLSQRAGKLARGAGLPLSDPVWFAQVAARNRITSSQLMDQLRNVVDAGHRPTRVAPVLSDVPRLGDIDTARKLAGLLNEPESPELLDTVFDPELLAANLGLLRPPLSARDAFELLEERLRSDILASMELQDWRTLIGDAIRKVPRLRLATALDCSERDVAEALLERPLAPPSAQLSADDELRQSLDFLSLDRVRAKLRELISSALAAGSVRAEAAAAIHHRGTEVHALPAGLIWRGPGSYREALLQVSAGRTEYTLRERGFGTSPEHPEDVKGLLPFGPTILFSPEKLDGEAVSAEQVRLAAVLGAPGRDEETDTDPETLLDTPLWKPSSLTELWRAFIRDEPKATAVFVLSGLEPPSAGLARPSHPDPVALPAPPTPLPTRDDVIQPDHDLDAWLKAPGGILA